MFFKIRYSLNFWPNILYRKEIRIDVIEVVVFNSLVWKYNAVLPLPIRYLMVFLINKLNSSSFTDLFILCVFSTFIFTQFKTHKILTNIILKQPGHTCVTMLIAICF